MRNQATVASFKTPSLSMEQIQKAAPAVFNMEKLEKLSQKYSVYNTAQLIKDMAQLGFVPVSVRQTRSRNEDNRFFQKHMIRFREAKYVGCQLQVGDIIPEIVVINSHNGRSGVTFYVGLFRVACSNGLMVANGDMQSISARHINIDLEILKKVIEEFAFAVKYVLGDINRYRNKEMSTPEMEAFAEEAYAIIYPQHAEKKFSPKLLLEARREYDRKTDLFTVFNVVQENGMNGGIEYQLKTQKDGETKIRKNKTRSVKNIDKESNVNLALWGLMNKYASM